MIRWIGKMCNRASNFFTNADFTQDEQDRMVDAIFSNKELDKFPVVKKLFKAYLEQGGNVSAVLRDNNLKKSYWDLLKNQFLGHKYTDNEKYIKYIEDWTEERAGYYSPILRESEYKSRIVEDVIVLYNGIKLSTSSRFSTVDETAIDLGSLTNSKNLIKVFNNQELYSTKDIHEMSLEDLIRACKNHKVALVRLLSNLNDLLYDGINSWLV